MPRVNGYAPGKDRGVQRRVERLDLAFAVRERDVALLAFVITRAPRGYLGAQSLELGRLTTHDLVALVARSARKISHGRHDGVRVRSCPLRLST